MKKLTVSEAIELANQGKSLRGVQLKDINEVKVNVQDAMTLSRQGIVIPEAQLFYDDNDIAYDEDIDELTPLSEFKKISWEEKEAFFAEEPKAPEMKPNYFAHETAVIDPGCTIGAGTKIWHFSHIMPDCTIGERCNIGQNVVVSPGVVLGTNVKVQNNVSIYTGVTCEDDVFLGPSCVFTNVTNPRSAVNRRGEYAPTNVGRGASIGANATIVCGNDLGAFCLIGAGAVVTKEVPPYALLVGNPARQLGWVSEYGHRLHFGEDGTAVCPESEQSYVLADGRVARVA